MRFLFPAALLMLSALVLPAQEDVPLPKKTEPASLPPEPAPSVPGLPKVQVAPTAPAFPARATAAPRVRLTPGTTGQVSSVHGGQFYVHGKSKEQRDLLLEEAERTRRMVAAALQTGTAFNFPIVVQIREAVVVRLVDEHRVRVRNIEAAFDDRRGQ